VSLGMLAIVAVKHHDPEADSNDDSCENSHLPVSIVAESAVYSDRHQSVLIM
jgi:hypothetical protein